MSHHHFSKFIVVKRWRPQKSAAILQRRQFVFSPHTKWPSTFWFITFFSIQFAINWWVWTPFSDASTWFCWLIISRWYPIVVGFTPDFSNKVRPHQEMLTSLEELSREKICNIVQELFSCCHAEALGSLGSGIGPRFDWDNWCKTMEI